MSLDQWRAMSDDELINLAHTLTPGHTDDVAVARILRARSAKREADSGAALVRATSRLVSTTGRLGTATWVLGGVTLLLVIAAAIPAYPLFRREDAGQRIRRECEAIMREAVAVAVEAGRASMAQNMERDGVLNCLFESAKGRR